jgi:hypothetical protein
VDLMGGVEEREGGLHGVSGVGAYVLCPVTPPSPVWAPLL